MIESRLGKSRAFIVYCETTDNGYSFDFATFAKTVLFYLNYDTRTENFNEAV